MYEFQVLLNPGDKVVFEGTFDKLMQDIRGQKFMDVGTWIIIRKWLLLLESLKQLKWG